MKKWSCLCLALALWLLPAAAFGWTPEAEYGALSELPASVQSALPDGLTVTYAVKAVEYLHVWAQNAQGDAAVCVFAQAGDGYALLVQSAPIGAWHGMEPRLGYSGRGFVTLQYSEDYEFVFYPGRDGRWALRYAHEYAGPDCFITFGAQSAGESLPEQETARRVFGNWTQAWYLDTLDVSTLPQTFDEALTMLDTQGWAMVCNAEPGGRAPLRTAADTGADAAGEYYTGTPVTVLKTAGGWARVSIAGTEGWLAAGCLVYGDAQRGVTAEYPQLALTEEACAAHDIIFASPSTAGAAIGRVDFDGADNPAAAVGLFIIGTAGEGWFHVMNLWGDCGYIESRWFFEGNG